MRFNWCIAIPNCINTKNGLEGEKSVKKQNEYNSKKTLFDGRKNTPKNRDKLMFYKNDIVLFEPEQFHYCQNQDFDIIGWTGRGSSKKINRKHGIIKKIILTQ